MKLHFKSSGLYFATGCSNNTNVILQSTAGGTNDFGPNENNYIMGFDYGRGW